MPAGASRKREREYGKLKKEFKHEGRYAGREEEVASRIVNTQRAKYGETKEAKEKDREGRSPDRGLPLRDYERLTVKQVMGKLGSLSGREIEKIERYEKQHKNRSTLIDRLERARAH